MNARTWKSCRNCGGLPGSAGIAGAILVLALLAGMENARAVTLTLSNVEDVRAGETGVDVSLFLSNGGAVPSVGGVQTDVSYDASILTLTTVNAGAAAQDAGKNVSFNEVSEGVVRVIISGLNQETIQDGALAALMFRTAANAPPGSYPVAMTVAQMVSPNGLQITGATVPGSVTIVGASEGENVVEGEGEGEGEAGTQSGCACAAMAPPHDPRSPGPGILLAAGFLMVCLGASRRELRQISRQ